jgi:hypothetical protein
MTIEVAVDIVILVSLDSSGSVISDNGDGASIGVEDAGIEVDKFSGIK